jgi:HK97 family phage major capsid protein
MPDIRTYAQVVEELQAKQKQLADLFAEHPSLDFTDTQVDDIQQRNAELADLGRKRDALAQVAEIRTSLQAQRDAEIKGVNHLPTAPAGQQVPQAKTLGQAFVESEEYKAARGRKGNLRHLVVDVPSASLKTLISTSAGWAPESRRIPRVVDTALRRPVVASLMPNTDTDAALIKYMEETTFTNAAATVSEGGTKPESALAWTERSVPMEKIATWVPVTEEQLADVPQMQSVIENRLTLMLALEEEDQVIGGNGTPPNLQGFLTKTGVQTQALGDDEKPDAIYKAMTLVRFTGFAEPSGAIFHPNDWQDFRLLQTTDGIYIWGPPSEAGPERIWGLPVVITPAMTENTALVGDFQMYSELFRKTGIQLKATDSHSDYFIKNQLVILAEERLALAIYRAAAFCKVTGL